MAFLLFSGTYDTSGPVPKFQVFATAGPTVSALVAPTTGFAVLARSATVHFQACCCHRPNLKAWISSPSSIIAIHFGRCILYFQVL